VGLSELLLFKKEGLLLSKIFRVEFFSFFSSLNNPGFSSKKGHL